MNQTTLHIRATDVCNGGKHGFSLFNDSRSVISAHIRVLADSGHQGIVDWHESSLAPTKKSKLYPLTVEQKVSNLEISKERIFVENVIRRLKIFRVLCERYRSRPSDLGCAST
ncbi:transposase family protein [Candidatus Roseilinea sp. NK_OTU-006]|uniref:transposase family protein n=1 Tax=Candidatus Roseilinea sp. NK_OTU-006 TaxID=2704250 RepID=UPI00403DDB08